MPTPEESIDRGLELYAALVRERPELNAELEASLAEFFIGGPPTGNARDTLLAARRHLEWFLLERHSPALFGAPVERLLGEWSTRSAGLDPEPLLASCTGVFQVTDVQPGEGALLRDLASLADYPVLEPEGAAMLEPGDLIVGRLFPLGSGLHHVSRAAGFLRDAVLVSALESDIEHARENTGAGKLLHVSQLELEAMFWNAPHRSEPAATTEAVGDARTWLSAAGLESHTIDAILARLASSPFDPRRLVHGAQDELGDILDELAFDTDIDLGDARRRLIAAWVQLARPTEAQAAGGAATPDPDPKVDARAALAAFEDGRRAGTDLETLFRDLQRDLGLDGPEPEDSDSEEETPAPDFPGVVGAMVEEYLWELGATSDPDRARHFSCLRSLGRFAEHIGAFEALEANDLLRFASFWLPETGAVRDGREALLLLEALEGFCDWAEENQDVRLGTEFRPFLERLRDSLPRVVEANRLLTPARAGDVGEVYEYLGATDGLRDASGDAHPVELDEPLRELLVPGDRLRGRIDPDGRAVVYRTYPPEVADLLGA